MKIVTGKIEAPIRTVIYGPEGIGKSTLASRWPSPLFLDIEGGTAEMNVARLERPQSWPAIMQAVEALARDMHGYKTLAIDTADWAEKLLRESVCAASQVKSLGDKPYGQLYTAVAAEWGRFLDGLTRIADAGAHIVLLAHSQIIHCDIPEESGSYDRYEMKLLNSFKVSLSGMTKEWASLVLFCSYETFVTEGKASGGKRVLRTSHHPCWDAKQRTGMNLPDKLDFPPDRLPAELAKLFAAPAPAPVSAPAPLTMPPTSQPAPDAIKPAQTTDPAPIADTKAVLLAQLKQLMIAGGIKLAELQAELARKGVVPADMLPPQYNGATLSRIVNNWTNLEHNIKRHRIAA